MLSVKAYYINLDHRPDRNVHFFTQILKSKVLRDKTSRYSAINGNNIDIYNLSSDFISDNSKNEALNKQEKTWGISLTPGAIGCALSHFYLYKKCIEDNIDIMCIFEDDIYIDSNIDFFIQEALRLEQNTFDMIYFGYSNNPKLIPLKDNIFFSQIGSKVHGTFSYLITRKGAIKLLENVFPINIQIDSEISNQIIKKKIIAYSTNSVVVRSDQSSYDSKFGTDIQGINGTRRTNISSLKDPLEDIFCMRKQN